MRLSSMLSGVAVRGLVLRRPAWFQPSFPSDARLLRRDFRQRCGGNFEYVVEMLDGSAKLFVLPVFHNVRREDVRTKLEKQVRPTEPSVTVKWVRVLSDGRLLQQSYRLSVPEFRWLFGIRPEGKPFAGCERFGSCVRFFVVEDVEFRGPECELHFVTDFQFRRAMQKMLAQYLASPAE